MPLRGNCNDEEVEICFSHQKKIHVNLSKVKNIVVVKSKLIIDY